MIIDFIVKTALDAVCPKLAGLVKPYLTAGAESLLVAEARKLVAALPAADVQEANWAGYALDSLAKAWGV